MLKPKQLKNLQNSDFILSVIEFRGVHKEKIANSSRAIMWINFLI